MTEFLLNQRPALSGRSRKIIASLLLLLVVALAYVAWHRAKLNSAKALATRLPTPSASAQVAAPSPGGAPAQAPVADPSAAKAVELAPDAGAKVTPATEASDPTAAAAAQGLLGEAQAAKAAGRLQDAREKAAQVLDGDAPAALRSQAETLLAQVGMELLLTPRPMPEKADYTVGAGDSLDRIARKYGTTVELIQKSNNLRGPLIRQGDRLRVFSGAWAIRVNKTRNDLVLSLNGKFFKRYRVGTGEFSKTPVGEFKIVDRIAQPTWWHPDGRTIPFGAPENLLGTHWLALDIKGYGIHGTWEPDTIGRQASMGCVRLLNEDVEELFTIAPIGTPVAIEE